MTDGRAANMKMLELVANRLGPLCADLVFVGGVTTSLLATDAGAVAIRATDDVDVIAEVASHNEYYALAKRLRDRGFREDPEGPICRWLTDQVKVDVMPTDPTILGFSNRWYAQATNQAREMTVGDASIRVITPTLFVATKLEAFHGRGQGDFMASHDLEDIVIVIDGRSEIVE